MTGEKAHHSTNETPTPTDLIDRHTQRGVRLVHGGETEYGPAELAAVLAAMPKPLQQAVLVGVPFTASHGKI